MPQAIYSVGVSIAGVAIAKNVVRTGDHPQSYEVSLPAGKAVTAWVKTSASIADCNLPSGHGYSNGNFDVYWSGGYRYGVPGTISTNALTLNGGSGTDFPASATTGIVVTKQVAINTAIDGDASQLFALSLELDDQSATTKGHINFKDVTPSQVAHFELTANVPQVYDLGGGATNPITGNPITNAQASNGSSTAAATLKIISMEDSTP